MALSRALSPIIYSVADFVNNNYVQLPLTSPNGDFQQIVESTGIPYSVIIPATGLLSYGISRYALSHKKNTLKSKIQNKKEELVGEFEKRFIEEDFKPDSLTKAYAKMRMKDPKRIAAEKTYEKFADIELIEDNGKIKTHKEDIDRFAKSLNTSYDGAYSLFKREVWRN